ncbi:MAG: hypothetical protein OXI33_00060 [Chloroflexota bacterium]|nr:hypothetical protein [Chloroflexota bacterium]
MASGPVDGNHLGSVRLAFAAAGPLVVRSGRIYSWVEDELEVPFVVRAAVAWGGEGPPP